METITVHEAVRRAIDPFGMSGQHTSAMRPTAADVIDRLLSQGYDIVPHKKHSISPDGDGSWTCDCGADGFDIFDLASHTNEMFAQPSEA